MSDNDVKIKVSLDGADDVQKGLAGVGTGASDADSKLGKLVSGGLKGAGVALVGFATAAAAAGGALAAGVIDQYAQYEQNIGGIETMFKDSSGKMMGYAADAYKTAGLSANEYMAQATSFSAALIQGLGGDTAAAAEVANRAITDMSDNSAKFGSNIADIQNAYGGFAKQNYTMLDNLKLGYGGTASEMARLVNESGVMGDSFTATAENINSISYDQIIAAIGAIQDEMGITGTTAKEASETISGSIDMLRGSFANLLTGLGDADADVATLAGNVIGSLELVIGNIQPVIEAIGSNIGTLGPQLGTMMGGVVTAISSAIPAVLGAGVALVGGLISGIISSLPSLTGAIIPGVLLLVETIINMAPELLTAGTQAVASLAIGIGNALPTLIPMLMSGIIVMIEALLNAAPMLIGAGLTLITGLGEGILAALPILITMLPVIIESLVTFLTTSIPAIIEAGIQLLLGLITAITTVIPILLTALPTIITSIITALLGAIPLLIQAGVTLLTALVTALPQIITSIVAALPQIITAVVTAIVGAVPQLIQAGIELLVALIGALPQIISTIVQAIPQIIGGIVRALIAAVPQILSAGVQVFTGIITAIPRVLGGIISGVGTIISGIVNALGNGIGQVVSIGGDLVRGIWSGISGAAGWLFDKIAGFAGDVMDNVAGFFGINSPSRRMRDEIGAHLPSGIGVGVVEHEQDAIQPIRSLGTKIMAEAGKLNTTANFNAESTLTQKLVPMQAMAQQSGPINVQATLDSSAISAALSDTFAQASDNQAPVFLSKESVNTLASAIVDSMRVQTRQGVSVLG